MGNITVFARMCVQPENRDKLQELTSAACEIAAGEPGTLAYEWHYSDDDATLVMLQQSADSAAHLAHMQRDGHGEFMGALMGMVDSLEFHILGEPSAELAEAVKSVPGAHFYAEIANK